MNDNYTQSLKLWLLQCPCNHMINIQVLGSSSALMATGALQFPPCCHPAVLLQALCCSQQQQCKSPAASLVLQSSGPECPLDLYCLPLTTQPGPWQAAAGHTRPSSHSCLHRSPRSVQSSPISAESLLKASGTFYNLERKPCLPFSKLCKLFL